LTRKDELLSGANAARNSAIAMALLAILKGVIGFLSGSIALIADAIHTSLDIFTSIAVWLGLIFSMREPGEKFQYGYFKAENLAAFIVSIIIFISGLELLREAILSLSTPRSIQLYDAALLVALLSALVLFALSKYKGRIGNRIGSQALIADARHSYVDVSSSLIVVIALMGSLIGISWLEGIAVILISIFIFRLGFSTARDSALVLLDAWLDPAVADKIRELTMAMRGVKGVDELRLRKSGLVVFGEMSVEVEGEVDVKRGEILSSEIESMVKREIKNLEHLAIHIKPSAKAMKKIAIPVDTIEGLKSKLSHHFGKAPFFIFIELEQGKIKEWKQIENPAAKLEKKMGMKAVELLIDEKIDALIVKGIGEGPFHVLRDNYIRVLEVPEDAEDVEAVLSKIEELKIIAAPVER
jgi:cation diffusion facilitator family transporter